MSETDPSIPSAQPVAGQSTSGRALPYEIGALLLFVTASSLEFASSILRGLPPLDALPGVGGGVILPLLIVLGISRFWKSARTRRATSMTAFITLLVLTVPAVRHFIGAVQLLGTVQGGRVVSHAVSFAPPKDWRRLDSHDENQIACFASPNVSTKLVPRKQIMIEAGQPSYPSAEASASSLAKQWGGRVLPETTTLDGVQAFQVRAKYRGKGLQPVEAVIAFHDGKVYLLMGGVSVNESCAREVEDLRRSWKWETP